MMSIAGSARYDTPGYRGESFDVAADFARGFRRQVSPESRFG
jgi:hypothetical protein